MRFLDITLGLLLRQIRNAAKAVQRGKARLVLYAVSFTAPQS
jgi:hypothetical protein